MRSAPTVFPYSFEFSPTWSLASRITQISYQKSFLYSSCGALLIVIMSTTPKKSAAKTKKPAAHPKYSEMVKSAVTSLKERSGSSRQAILKYIIANYNVGVDPKSVNSHLKVALRNGVESGSLKQSKGTGASGSFRMGEKEKTEKKPAPKKVTKPKAAAKPKAPKPKSTPKKAAKAKKPVKKDDKKPKKTTKPKTAGATKTKKAVKQTPKKASKPKTKTPKKKASKKE